MASFGISVDLSELKHLTQVIDRSVFPALREAVGEVAHATEQRWKEAVFHARLWTGEKQAYTKSMGWEYTGEFSAVVTATYRYAEEIEQGRPAKDLKRMLDTSMKVRVSKKGKRYLIIPFRHNTPGNTALAKAMPPEIYEVASQMKKSRVVGQGKRLSGTGAFDIKTKKQFLVSSRKYQWGDRLPRGLAPKLKPHHATDIYAGMVRFNTTGTGKAKSSAYLTFRVMVEGSSKWIVPPQPGLHLAENVAQDMQPLAEKAFQAAVQHALGS